MAKLPDRIRVGSIEFIVEYDPTLPPNQIRLRSTGPVSIPVDYERSPGAGDLYTQAESLFCPHGELYSDSDRCDAEPPVGSALSDATAGEEVEVALGGVRPVTAEEIGVLTNRFADKIRADIDEFDTMRDKARRYDRIVNIMNGTLSPENKLGWVQGIVDR